MDCVTWQRSIVFIARRYTIGRTTGELMGPRIRAALETPFVRDMREYAGGQGRSHFAALRRAVEADARFSPLLREVQGLADGAGVVEEDIFLLNTTNELALLKHGEMVPQCSDVLVPKAGVWGHNEDGRTANAELAYLVTARVEGDKDSVYGSEEYTVYQYPGQLATGAFGFNAHGVVLAFNALPPLAVNTSGIPRHFVHRYLLGAATAEDAVARLQSVQVACGFSANIGQVGRPHEMFNVETHGVVAPHAHVLKVDKEPYFHANMYRRFSVAERQDLSSIHRLRRFQALAPPSSMADVRAILGDTSDSAFPIWRTDSPPDHLSTLCTMFVDLATGDFSITIRNPSSPTARPVFRHTIVPRSRT